jgi:hypothetical protein
MRVSLIHGLSGPGTCPQVHSGHRRLKGKTMRTSQHRRRFPFYLDTRAILATSAFSIVLLLATTGPLIGAPVVVDISQSSQAPAQSYQRKLWRDSRYYFWTFYFDGTNTYYERSDDTTGATWVGTRQLFFAGSVQPSAWLDADSVYVAFSSGGDILVRRGVIAGGSITWSSPSIALDGNAGISYTLATICEDENGFLWVAARAQSLTGYYACATRSVRPRNETSWQASQMISPISSSSSLYVLVVPLTKGDVYAVWNVQGSIRGKRYADGTGWEAAATSIATGFSGNQQKLFSGVGDRDGRLHLLYVAQSGRVGYRRYDGSSWGNEQILNNRTDSACPTISINPSNLRTYALWVEYNSRRIQRKSAVLPAVSGDWRTEAANLGTYARSFLTSCYSSMSRVCWLFAEGGGAPYTLMFDGIAVARISVLVSNSAFVFGTQPVNSWLPARISLVTNDGTWPENIYGKLSGFVSGAFAWAIAASNGPDRCRAQWSTVSDAGPWNNIAPYDSEFLITSNLQTTNSITLYFRIQTPTSTSSYNEYASNFTVRAQDY